MEKVTIIVPVYQVELFLERCIKSLIQQTYKNIEIILVDDGSTDKSGEICEKYKKLDNRIKVIHKINGGVSSSRNCGIDNADGEYLIFVDADDYVDKNYVKTLVNICKKQNVDIGIIGTNDIVEDNIVGRSIAYTKKVDKKEALRFLINSKYFTCTIWGKIYKKSLFDNIKFNIETKISEDMEIIYKLFDKTEKDIYIDTSALLYYYTIRSNSALHSKISKDHIKEIEILENFIFFIDNEYYDLHDDAVDRYINKNIELIFKMIEDGVYNNESIEYLKNNILKYKSHIKKMTLKCKLKIFIALYFRYLIKIRRKIKLR